MIFYLKARMVILESISEHSRLREVTWGDPPCPWGIVDVTYNPLGTLFLNCCSQHILLNHCEGEVVA